MYIKKPCAILTRATRHGPNCTVFTKSFQIPGCKTTFYSDHHPLCTEFELCSQHLRWYQHINYLLHQSWKKSPMKLEIALLCLCWRLENPREVIFAVHIFFFFCYRHQEVNHSAKITVSNSLYTSESSPSVVCSWIYISLLLCKNKPD